MARLLLSLCQRALKHDFLLGQLLTLSLELVHALVKELDLLLALVKLVVQIL